MLYSNLLSKIFITLFILGIAVWLGGSVIRTITAYDIYIPATELKLKPEYSNELRMQTVRLYGIGALYTEIAYSMSFISSIYLCVYWRKQLKQRGWLFMAFILFFITVPFELFMIYFDIKLNIAVMWGNIKNFGDESIQKYFENRFRKLNFISPMSYLAVITSIFFLVWKPLDKTKKQ